MIKQRPVADSSSSGGDIHHAVTNGLQYHTFGLLPECRDAPAARGIGFKGGAAWPGDCIR
jgi:hypothetical protein